MKVLQHTEQKILFFPDDEVAASKVTPPSANGGSPWIAESSRTDHISFGGDVNGIGAVDKHGLVITFRRNIQAASAGEE